MAVNVSNTRTIPLSIVAGKKKIDKCSNEIGDLNAVQV